MYRALEIAFATALLLATASAATCPGSKAHFHHAKTELSVSFKNSCADVQKMIKARVSGQASGAWVDPHNKGVYTITTSSSAQMALDHLTGNKKYTDKLLLTFSGSGSSCTLDACSESQVFSVLDMSTNYCNLHDLYCSDTQCNADKLGPKLSYTEKITENSSGQHSTSDCYKSTFPSALVAPLEELLVTPSGVCDHLKGQTGVVHDIHDGDLKKVTFSNDGDALTIVPHGNNQSWIVHAAWDAKKCSAVIDFNVPGKPGVPPVNLTATYYIMQGEDPRNNKSAFEFTDPSGTIADPTMPLNEWVVIQPSLKQARLGS